MKRLTMRCIKCQGNRNIICGDCYQREMDDLKRQIEELKTEISDLKFQLQN